MELGGMGLERRAPAQRLGQGPAPEHHPLPIPGGWEGCCWTRGPTMGTGVGAPIGPPAPPMLLRCLPELASSQPSSGRRASKALALQRV